MSKTRIKLPQTIEGCTTYVECGYNTIFVCVLEEGHEVEKPTWEALQETVTAWTKRQKTKKKKKFTPIPLLHWSDGMLLPANATGIHAGTNNPIIKVEGHKAEQVSGWQSSYLIPMSDADQEILVKMYVKSEKATHFFKLFYERFRIEHLGDWVNKKAGED